MIVHKHVKFVRMYKSVCGVLGSQEEPCVHDWEKVTCEKCLAWKKENEET